MALSSSGITVSAVKTALGVSNNNVGGLCTDDAINPWSRWKPISLNATTLTDTLLANANYGITIKYSTTAAGLLTLVKNNSNLGYVYNRPAGLATSPYRLGDFRNYEHNAILPVESFYKDADEVPINGVSSSYSTNIEGLALETPTDLTSVDYLTKGHIYPSTVANKGALVTDGTNTYWSVGSIPWGNTYWQKFAGKSVTVLEFFTNLSSGTLSTTHTSSSSDLFYALPEPLHTIYVTNTSPSGSKIAFPVYATLSFVDNDYSKIQYEFCLSTVGDVYAGGTITNLRCGVCSDSAGTNVLASKTIATSLTLVSEGTSLYWNGTFSTTNTTALVYFCIWYNNKLQHYTVPLLDPTIQPD